jgi:hypothetical protein
LQVFGVLNKIVGFNQISDVFGDEWSTKGK